MSRPKKDKVNIAYYIRRDIKERLDIYCEEKRANCNTCYRKNS